MNLRECVENDLSISLEGDWGLYVELINPDGEIINVNQNTGEKLKGQVLFGTLETNMETGETLMIQNPNVSLRISSLADYPTKATYKNGWFARIPLTPSLSAPLVTHKIAEAPLGGESIGFLTLFLEKAAQSS